MSLMYTHAGPFVRRCWCSVLPLQLIVYNIIPNTDIHFTAWVPVHVSECADLHTHACPRTFMSCCLSVCAYLCLGLYAATLHGDSIPTLGLSTGLSLAVTSHHLPVSDTAEQRAAYEQWGDGRSPSAEWQTMALSDCVLLEPLLSSWEAWPSRGMKNEGKVLHNQRMHSHGHTSTHTCR